MTGLEQFLQEQSCGGLLPWASQAAAAERFGFSCAQVEDIALTMGLLPSRYQRNRQAISVGNQLKLFRSRVAVLGCGGLGGYVIEELARLGVGTLIAIDPDIFEEHNLNRQILSTSGSLKQAKVHTAAARIAEINPAITLIPIQVAWAPENGKKLFQCAHVVVDALDSVSTRLAVAKACAEMGVPFVHGAIAGWYGQVTTQFPGDETVFKLYGRVQETKGVEQQLGNPAFTPAVVASIQAAEVCKVLLGVGNTLRNRTILINLLDMTFEELGFSSQEMAAGA